MILEVCWDGIWTLSFGLSQVHGHGPWLVCEVALDHNFQDLVFGYFKDRDLRLGVLRMGSSLSWSHNPFPVPKTPLAFMMAPCGNSLLTFSTTFMWSFLEKELCLCPYTSQLFVFCFLLPHHNSYGHVLVFPRPPSWSSPHLVIQLSVLVYHMYGEISQCFWSVT